MSEKKFTSKQLDLQDTKTKIENAVENINKAHIQYKEMDDVEFKVSYKEDAYLNYLIALRESKFLGEKSYNTLGIERLTGLTYEHLSPVEFDDYVMS